MEEEIEDYVLCLESLAAVTHGAELDAILESVKAFRLAPELDVYRNHHVMVERFIQAVEDLQLNIPVPDSEGKVTFPS